MFHMLSTGENHIPQIHRLRVTSEWKMSLRPGRISSGRVCAEKHLPERNTLGGVLGTEQSERGWRTASAVFVRSNRIGGGVRRGTQSTMALRLGPKNNEDREKCWVWKMTSSGL